MNRQQRRFLAAHPPKPQKPKLGKAKQPQLREMPTFALLAVMNEILGILQERGTEMRDWDHKDKVVRMFKSIGNKLYMLATIDEATEADTNGEKQGSEKSGE